MNEQLRDEIVNSTVVFQGRLLTIRVDTIRLPDGRTGTRDVVVHPGAVALVPIIGDEVILVRQWRLPAGQALLELPAGTLGQGEDPADCACRELMEEAGYRPGRLTPLGSIFLAPGYSTERLHLFLAEDLVPEQRAQDEDENVVVERYTWAEIDAMIDAGAFADAKTITGLLLAQRLLAERA